MKTTKGNNSTATQKFNELPEHLRIEVLKTAIDRGALPSHLAALAQQSLDRLEGRPPASVSSGPLVTDAVAILEDLKARGFDIPSSGRLHQVRAGSRSPYARFARELLESGAFRRDRVFGTEPPVGKHHQLPPIPGHRRPAYIVAPDDATLYVGRMESAGHNRGMRWYGPFDLPADRA